MFNAIIIIIIIIIIILAVGYRQDGLGSIPGSARFISSSQLPGRL
jgi:hypothetical protein